MEIHGESMENPWKSMEIYGNPWVHGFLKEASLRRLPEGGVVKEAS